MQVQMVRYRAINYPVLFIVFNGSYSRLIHGDEDLNPLNSFNAWYLVLLMLLEEEDEQ